MKKNLSILLLMVWVCLVSCGESKQKAFGRIAKEWTEKCPRAINEFTRLDSVVYLPQKNINQYYYTLIGDADNVQSIDANKKEMESALVDKVANSMEMNTYKDFNVTLEYIYHSGKNHTELLRVKITPEQYK